MTNLIKLGTLVKFSATTRFCLHDIQYDITEFYSKSQILDNKQLLKMFSIYLHNQNENNYIKYPLQVSSFFSTLPNFMYRYVFFKDFIWTLRGKE